VDPLDQLEIVAFEETAQDTMSFDCKRLGDTCGNGIDVTGKPIIFT
jgi:hypothetical protein